MEKHLALFDFDGTLTRKDTLFDFARFAVGEMAFVGRLLRAAPVLILHKAGMVGATAAKESFLTTFFGGWAEARFEAAAVAYCTDRLPALLQPEAMHRLAWHLAQGHEVVIVSASAEDWIRPWASAMGLEVLATQLERHQGKITGKLASPNCNGPEKVARIQARFPMVADAITYAYGDSAGDQPMLGLANHAFFRKFV